MKKLGEFIKEKREAMGLSLRDASKLSGVSHTHIEDIEDGSSTPSFEMVMKFLKAYMVDKEQWKPFYATDGIKTDRELAETVHTMERTEEAFRLIVIRWINPQRNLFVREDYCYHCIATNLKVLPQEAVWTHNDRGQMENYIKELKGGFGLEQMPSGDFFDNALYFALGVLVYNSTVAQNCSFLQGSGPPKPSMP